MRMTTTPMLLTAGLLAIASLSGCATPPTAGLDCVPDSRGPNAITYGTKNSKTIFEVKDKVYVKQGRGLTFKLAPKNKGSLDFDDAVVKLRGKENSPYDNSWFDEVKGSYTGTAADGHVIGLCAKDVKDGTYEYEIHIEGFGMLDPRVIVEK